jgi:dihydroflavonol-4-reductase
LGEAEVKACVTGATGYVGGHVARLLAERGDEVRVTYRDARRLERLADISIDPVSADVLDRSSLRRAMRGCEVVFHTAGYVGSHPRELLWQMNALSPRLVVEAAAAEMVPRVVLTSSVAAVGPALDGETADEANVYRSGGLSLAYGDAKHEGEAEALAAGARLGIDVVVVNPSYVLGVPVDRSQPGETSTRTVGNYLLGRLPAIVDGNINVVDVVDVAKGHLLAGERGHPGERYILGGFNLTWAELIDRIAVMSGTSYPLLVLPTEVAYAAKAQDELSVPGPIAPDAFMLMAQSWRYSSRKARRELGYRTRPLEKTLRETIDWYHELIANGTFRGRGMSSLSLASAGMRFARRLGVVGSLRAAERYLDRRLIAGA